MEINVQAPIEKASDLVEIIPENVAFQYDNIATPLNLNMARLTADQIQ